MTPEHAALLFEEFNGQGGEPGEQDILDALRTIAAMRTEEDHRLVDTDTNGGVYETRRHIRHVTQWEEE